jgi:phage replication O-like protein O
MANPQKENGFTAIANEIMDALIAADLSGQDFKIALLIIRKTYGFNKTEDAVSLSQMMKATTMCKIRCSQVVNRLELMKILTVTENINGIGKKYKFNKDFDTWQTVNKNINRYKKMKGTVNEKRNRPLMKTLTTKDTLTKDTLTKDNTPIVPKGSPYSNDFLIFYTTYPKHKGRDAAWKAWKKRNGDMPDIGIIVGAINRQKLSEQWLKNRGKYIPHPATWINQGCWADEETEVHPMAGAGSEVARRTVANLEGLSLS